MVNTIGEYAKIIKLQELARDRRERTAQGNPNAVLYGDLFCAFGTLPLLKQLNKSEITHKGG